LRPLRIVGRPRGNATIMCVTQTDMALRLVGVASPMDPLCGYFLLVVRSETCGAVTASPSLKPRVGGSILLSGNFFFFTFAR